MNDLLKVSLYLLDSITVMEVCGIERVYYQIKIPVILTGSLVSDLPQIS
jgi:hypothetical protein